MSLPLLTLPLQEKWDCHQCGICCRGSLVPLSDEDLARLKSQKWESHPDFQYTDIVVPIKHSTKTHRLAQRADGSCVFLKPDGLCRIHAELGFEAKPTICRVFPLQLIPQDRHVVLTLRRACPSSALDRGQPLQGHQPMMQQLVNDGQLSAEAIAAPPIKSSDPRDWKSAKLVLAATAHLICDERFPPVRRLVHALQFAGLLQKAKTRSMDDRKFAELVQTLREVVVEESRPFFTEKRPPSSYARVFFRQVALEYARLHPSYQAKSSWRQRVEMIGMAWRMVRGKGETPNLSPPFPQRNFDLLEQPLGLLPPSVDLPLSRLLETTSSTYLYALTDRKGWTIVESIQALAMLFPIGYWLLRWGALQGTPSVEEMTNIVVALDRGQGYRSLTWAPQRWRLRLLARNQELERLVVWYAQ